MGDNEQTATEDIRSESTVANKSKFKPCEICGKTDFYSPATRGSHMWFVHHIQGESSASKSYLKKKAAKQDVTERKAVKPVPTPSVPIEKRTYERTAKKVTRANTIQKDQAAHIIYLTGYFQCFLEVYCRGHEIPATLIAIGVGQNILSQASR